MKPLFLQLLTLAGLVLLTSAGLAQSSSRKVSFGIRVGANFSKLDELWYQTPRLDQNGLPMMSGGNVVYDFFQQNDARSTGLVGGLYARFGNLFYIQPEVLFSVKGGRFDIVGQGLQTQSVDIKVGSIDIPILLGIRLGPLRVNAGPMASLNVLNSDFKGTLNQYGSQPFSQTTKQAQLGYQAGIGLSLMGLQLDLRHEGGLKVTSSADPANNVPARANVWQLTAGFGF